jgi:nucleotide-binding universal stress UspA family protein
VATTLIFPTQDPQVPVQAGLRKLLVCFSSSDDWRTLVTIAGKLAVPGKADVQICYKDLTNLYAIRGTEFNGQEYRVPLGSLSSSLQAARALREMGLNVEFTDLPELRQQHGQRTFPYWDADLIVMTTAFNRSIALGSQDLASRAVRLLGKPILYLHADQRSSEATRSRTGPAVAAVSLSERSIKVVQLAAQHAEALESSLTVVHIVDSLHDFSRPDNLMSLMGACEILGKSVAQSTIRTSSRLTHGAVADVLTQSDFLNDASFLALGVDLQESKSDAEKSDALQEMIVRNAPCPVLLVPENQPDPTV